VIGLQAATHTVIPQWPCAVVYLFMCCMFFCQIFTTACCADNLGRVQNVAAFWCYRLARFWILWYS